MADTRRPTIERRSAEPVRAGTNGSAGGNGPHGFRERMEEGLALRQLVRDYMVPVETNNVWYVLGGVLAIALVLEFLTGCLLLFKYIPDAGQAYAITRALATAAGWSIVLKFHFFDAFVIFGLVMVHMMRVFISAAYRGGKQVLWLSGAVLAGLVFLATLTGETLHWDEVGFAVPWHTSEFLQATGLAGLFHYNFADLKNIPTATTKLAQFYGLHVSLVPILLLLVMVVHYYLIKAKGISLPFWIKPSGRKAPFAKHMRGWFVYGGAILGIMLLLALFWHYDVGIAPQLLPSSPFFGSTHGPGALGVKPSFPISWTHGMNVFVGKLGVKPDIWGTVTGMTIMTVALLIIPFVDRVRQEPTSWKEAFNLRQRGWAFLAMAFFWAVMIVGIVTNALAVPE